MSQGGIATGHAFDFAAQRRMMVDGQVRTFDVTELALQSAMYDIPRERFVDPAHAALSYADRELPSAGGSRWLLAPMVLARMIQAAALESSDRVLDVGGGAGYSAAIMARLAGAVVALESDAGFAAAASVALSALGERRVSCVVASLDKGYPASAPYDAILVNGGMEVNPSALLDQLKEGGCLVGIDLSSGAPRAVRFERTGRDFSKRPLFDASAPALDGFRRAPSFVF